MRVPITAVNSSLKSLTVYDDLCDVFSEGREFYIINLANQLVSLLTVDVSVYDPLTNMTTVTVNQQLSVEHTTDVIMVSDYMRLGDGPVQFMDPDQFNSGLTPLRLPGSRISSNYSFMLEDILDILKNFSGFSPPNNPVRGQLWHNIGSLGYGGGEQLELYDGSRWVPITNPAAPSSVPVTIHRLLITSTGQTVFDTPLYVVGSNKLWVYVNGIKAYLGDSYVEDSPTQITFTYTIPTGTKVELLVVGA
jgi:hypothetical protein